MKIINKLFKTLGLIFVFIAIMTLYGCENTAPAKEQLNDPSFVVTTNDKKATVFIEQTLHADGYFLYIYDENGLKNKFSVSPELALQGYEVVLNYGEYQFAVQATDSTATYTDSLISNKKTITLTEKVKPHEHKFVDGICSCGEIDPNYNFEKTYS